MVKRRGFISAAALALTGRGGASMRSSGDKSRSVSVPAGKQVSVEFDTRERFGIPYEVDAPGFEQIGSIFPDTNAVLTFGPFDESGAFEVSAHPRRPADVTVRVD